MLPFNGVVVGDRCTHLRKRTTPNAEGGPWPTDDAGDELVQLLAEGRAAPAAAAALTPATRAKRGKKKKRKK